MSNKNESRLIKKQPFPKKITVFTEVFLSIDYFTMGISSEIMAIAYI